MSRPSSTPPSRAATHSRCRRTISARTAGLAATMLTARLTSGPRISMRGVDAVDRHAVGPDLELDVGHDPRDLLGLRRVDAAAQGGEGDRRGTSRRCRGTRGPRRSASALATVDLPDPAGPSMAMILMRAGP